MGAGKVICKHQSACAKQEIPLMDSHTIENTQNPLELLMVLKHQLKSNLDKMSIPVANFQFKLP